MTKRLPIIRMAGWTVVHFDYYLTIGCRVRSITGKSTEIIAIGFDRLFIPEKKVTINASIDKV